MAFLDVKKIMRRLRLYREKNKKIKFKSRANADDIILIHTEEEQMRIFRNNFQ